MTPHEHGCAAVGLPRKAEGGETAEEHLRGWPSAGQREAALSARWPPCRRYEAPLPPSWRNRARSVLVALLLQGIVACEVGRGLPSPPCSLKSRPMKINVSELPDVARHPLLLALRLQAAASIATAQESRTVLTSEGPMDEYAKHMKRAKSDGLLAGDSFRMGNTPKEVATAADNLWAVGIMQVQRLIAAGEWYPSTLDLGSKLNEIGLLNRGEFSKALRSARS